MSGGDAREDGAVWSTVGPALEPGGGGVPSDFVPCISRKDISLPEEGLESEVSSHLPSTFPASTQDERCRGRDLKAQTWGRLRQRAGLLAHLLVGPARCLAPG